MMFKELRWRETIEGLIIASIFAGIVVLVIFACIGENDARKRFMAECLHDHKQYECTAMWRAANPPAPQTYIYMPSTVH